MRQIGSDSEFSYPRILDVNVWYLLSKSLFQAQDYNYWKIKNASQAK